MVYAEHDRERPEYSVRRGAYDGVPFVEVVFNYGITRFEETYANPRMDALFAKLLDEEKPDVVHFEHLQHFSVGCVSAAKARALPVVFTLHEYCLTCPRKGLRMMADASLCDALVKERCAVCIEKENVHEPTARARLEAWAKRVVPARARRFVRKRLATIGVGRHPDLPPPEPTAAPVDRSAHERAIEKRWDAIRRACADVDLFVAPSPFLRAKFVEFGVDPGKIVFSDYGTDLAPFEGFARRESVGGRIRFGYVGTLVEHKGVHVLVEAMNSLPRGVATLLVHGEPAYFPAYAARLREISTHPDTRFMGPFDNARIADILRDVDVLVVPSIWFENSPLTIHEAYAAGAPVVATDLGGMKDLVRDGVSGLLFRRGDAADLARALGRLASEKGLLDRLRAGIPRVKTVDEDAADMEARYARLLRRRRTRRR